VNVEKVQLEDGKTVSASQYGQNVELVAIGELSTAELEMVEKVKVVLCYIIHNLCILII